MSVRWRALSISPAVLIPVVYLLATTASFWGEAPALDPLVIFTESATFFARGMTRFYTEHTNTVHPPLLFILDSLAFAVFGPTAIAYSMVGVVLYTAMSAALWNVTRLVFSDRTALVLNLLLFCNPCILTNAFYPSNDFVILFTLILALNFFIKRRPVLFALSLMLASINKETGLMTPAAFFLVTVYDVMRPRDDRPYPWARRVRELVYACLPLVPAALGLVAWMIWLRVHGGVEWRGEPFNFDNDKADSSFVLVVKNLQPARFFSNFLWQNLRNLIVLNFQWVYLLLGVFGAVRLKAATTGNDDRRRYAAVLVVFFGLYILTVLSFHTWTIPRYDIPCFLPLIFLAAIGLEALPPTVRTFAFGILLPIVVLSDFQSADPVTGLYGHFDSYSEQFYDLPYMPNGPDRQFYNRQYFVAASRQNALFRRAAAERGGVIDGKFPCFSWEDYAFGLRTGEKTNYISDRPESFPDVQLSNRLKCAVYKK